MKSKKMIGVIFLSILCLALGQLGAQLIASGFLLIKVPDYICNIIAGILYVIISYYLIKLLCTKYLKSSLDEFYITKIRFNIKWIIVAILLPIIVAGIYLLLPGKLSSNNFDLSEKLVTITAGICFMSIAAGIVEEMVFRGIIMNSLSKRYNKKIAIIVPSLLFGFVHILGMKFNLLSCLLVIISGTMVGIMFSLIADEGKSIWNSAIVHILWNIVMISGIIHIGNSIDKYSMYNYLLNTKSFIISGGEFGIESSLFTTIGYIIVSLIAIVMIKNKKIKK